MAVENQLKGCFKRMFATCLAVKTATIPTKSPCADSGKSWVSVTCGGRFGLDSCDFIRPLPEGQSVKLGSPISNQLQLNRVIG